MNEQTDSEGQPTLPDERSAGEVVEGRAITVSFDGSKCIHARFCVLLAPTVFKANTEGAWIDPDAVDARELAAVARNCPSGAIQYRLKEPPLDETPPLVNVIRLRENGPYAFHGQLQVAGERKDVTRRTLCRCGASRHKPYCDGSHVAAGSSATGEPESFESAPLAVRSGPVEVAPMRNGPLEVRGAVEIVCGSGRVLARSKHCLLCRCGGSQSKPFCDGAHAVNGFGDRDELVAPTASNVSAPSLCEWAGGRDALRKLTATFYDKVPNEPLLAPLFAHMGTKHTERVADFIVEVFGGPPAYTDSGGNHIGMVSKHLGRGITEAQRARWVELVIETANDVGLPSDRAFREAFEAYLEWGSKLAVINSADGIELPDGDWPMPRWGWGPAGGPERE